MKKVTLLIVFLMLIALTTYAADIAVSVSGESKLTFAVNLDTNTTGFLNENSSKISFAIVSGSSEKGKPEDGDVYGWIKVSDWAVKVDGYLTWAGKNGDVSAKIIFPNGYVQISGTDASIGYASIVQDDDANGTAGDSGVLSDSLANSGGFVLGLSFAPISIAVGVFSEAGIDVDNNYGASLKATVDIAPIKIEAGVLMGINHSNTGIGLGGKITANIAPLSIYAALDMTVDGSVTVLEVAGGASVAVAGITLSADVSYNESLDGLDARIKIDAGGMVPNLGLSLTVELFNMLGAIGADTDADMEYSVAASLSYNAGQFKPYANIRYGTFTVSTDTYTYAAAGSEPFKLNLGVEAYLIPNVTFILDYNSDNLTAAPISNGKISFITKIAL